ncbi:MAG: hypothetical protein ACK59B_13485, partial [Alphaproteobacteria bacterium]
MKMAQKSPTRRVPFRLGCWLMAGASGIARASAARATETVSPFWVRPAVLADAAKPQAPHALPASSLPGSSNASRANNGPDASGARRVLRPILTDQQVLRLDDLTHYMSRLPAGTIEMQPLL